jgi:hypothetical protein
VTGTTSSADAGLDQDLPGVLDLGDRRHVGHRAAGAPGREDHLLVRAVRMSALSAMKWHAAEDDVLGVRAARASAGELERVAGDVGELDHLVALVVVAEHEDPGAEAALAACRSTRSGPTGGQVAGHSTPRSVSFRCPGEHEEGSGAGAVSWTESMPPCRLPSVTPIRNMAGTTLVMMSWIITTSFASVVPPLRHKGRAKGRTKDELDEVDRVA